MRKCPVWLVPVNTVPTETTERTDCSNSTYGIVDGGRCTSVLSPSAGPAYARGGTHQCAGARRIVRGLRAYLGARQDSLAGFPATSFNGAQNLCKGATWWRAAREILAALFRVTLMRFSLLFLLRVFAGSRDSCSWTGPTPLVVAGLPEFIPVSFLRRPRGSKGTASLLNQGSSSLHMPKSNLQGESAQIKFTRIRMKGESCPICLSAPKRNTYELTVSRIFFASLFANTQRLPFVLAEMFTTRRRCKCLP